MTRATTQRTGKIQLVEAGERSLSFMPVSIVVLKRGGFKMLQLAFRRCTPV